MKHTGAAKIEPDKQNLCRRYLPIALLVCLIAPIAGQANTKMDRHEKMVMNLRYGTGSAGFYILESMKMGSEMEKNLRKALYQVREVDKSYAKSRGKPDSLYLEPASLKIQRCHEKAQALNNEIKDSFLELKTSINDTLLLSGADK